MKNPSFINFVCWKDERISRVINTEAIAVERTDFLATHSPFKQIKYAKVAREIPNTSEDAFLAELKNQALKDQHVFAVIQGIPGTGKSHLIRWLKEKYFEPNSNEVVLLIERANSSLQGTLRQIIKSGVFDARTMKDELDRLTGAADQLSDAALEDNVLNNLQLATNEVQLPPDKLPPKKILRNIENFLLDPNIRSWLKEEKGPVKRIVRYVSNGRQPGLNQDELPGFEADDFKAPGSLLTLLRREGANDNAKTLAELLNDPDDQDVRKSLADYLNRLLNFAIGHTTSLSADALKEMFNKLRRNLRREKKSLVLFIEDITAFTGIDAGLIDVLATQHTGEGNKEFCRLISVIGITDSYYTDRFPDNLRDRITHRLILNNKIESPNPESDLLQTPDAVADLVSRYLNAIRLDEKDLKKWGTKGSDIRSIPNPCYECPYRPVCHEAFGFVSLVNDLDDDRMKVGLYPFNENALWQMYQNILITNVARTPRSLLRSVVQYVLQSHGEKIRSGKFPPPQNEIGSDFRSPSLEERAQLRIIQDQGKQDAARIETLVLFWGNRTVNTQKINGESYVAGLSPNVFNAFSIPMIKGLESGQEILGSPTLPPPRSAPTTSSIEETKKYADDLRDWLGGKRLNYVDEYQHWMASLIESFYDWERYGISMPQVKERVKPAKIAFEAQFGKVTLPNIFFERTQETYQVLNALIDLYKQPDKLVPQIIGTHLTILGTWLRQQESRIVDFVQHPASIKGTTTLLEITFLDSVGCAVFSGGITSDTLSAIYQSLMGTSQNDDNWSGLENTLRGIRSSEWLNVFKRLAADDVSAARRQWLQQINHPQGNSTDVRFVDAAKVLDLIEKVKANNWDLTFVDLPDELDDSLWSRFGQVYQDLKALYSKAIREEQVTLKSKLKKLNDLLGDAKADKVFNALSDLLITLSNNQMAHDFKERRDLTASELEDTGIHLSKIASAEEFSEMVLGLSSCQKQLGILNEYIKYLEDFSKEATKIERSLLKETKNLASRKRSEDNILQADNLYKDIERTLSGIVDKSTARKDDP